MDAGPVAWVSALAVILALLSVDLLLGSIRRHAVGFREALAWSAFYIGVAALFGVVPGTWAGWDFGSQYFAGYLVEKSLSVDNLFVFAIIMSTFAVPPRHQQRVLAFGILAALILRGIFIAVGATLLSLFSFVFLLFGLLLMWTAVQLYRHRDEDPDIGDSVVIRTLRRVVPVTEDYVGGRLLTKQDGRRMATPAFVVFAAIGATDILFALDSIPAVFGITRETYIVFTANAFALWAFARCTSW